MKKIIAITMILTASLWSNPIRCFAQTEGRSRATTPVSPAETKEAMKNLSEVYSGLAFRRVTAKETVPPLQVQFTGTSERALESMNEDLLIMSHLLSKTVEKSSQDDAPTVKMGVPLLVSAASSSVRAVYLDGFGALFMVKVGFPVVGPTITQVRKTEEGSESEWNTAIKELSGDDNEGWDSQESTAAVADYDPGQVEALKSGLLLTLRNASNIRYLKPEEFVAISIFGSPAPLTTLTEKLEQTEKPKKASKGDNNKPREGNRGAQVRELARREAKRGTVMTIRVHKSDVDLFAKKSLDFDGFQRKATVCSYFGGGYSTTSLNSWSQGAYAPVGAAR